MIVGLCYDAVVASFFNSLGEFMRFHYNDGGRHAAGFRAKSAPGDCVARAIAIAAERPYREVYEALNEFAKNERFRRGRIGYAAATGRGSSARTGVHKETTRDFIAAYLGWKWTPTMKVGQGCTVHLRDGELPDGRLIVSVSTHLTAVIYGTIEDLYDPSRGGSRCVYGYWQK